MLFDASLLCEVLPSYPLTLISSYLAHEYPQGVYSITPNVVPTVLKWEESGGNMMNGIEGLERSLKLGNRCILKWGKWWESSRHATKTKDMGEELHT